MDFSNQHEHFSALNLPPIKSIAERVAEEMDRLIRDVDNQYYFGGNRLEWPNTAKFIQIYSCAEGRFSKKKKAYKVVENFNKMKPLYQEYFGCYHRPDQYLFVPRLLQRHSNVSAEHRPDKEHRKNKDAPWGGDLGEYPMPLRYTLEGDDPDIINRFKNIPTDFPCGYCLGHPQPESCTLYRTPAERLARIQEINYNLFHMGQYQLCTSCLQREVNHVQYIWCREQRACGYCPEPGHHESLCTSGPHVQALAVSQAALYRMGIDERLKEILQETVSLREDHSQHIQSRVDRVKQTAHEEYYADLSRRSQFLQHTVDYVELEDVNLNETEEAHHNRVQPDTSNQFEDEPAGLTTLEQYNIPYHRDKIDMDLHEDTVVNLAIARMQYHLGENCTFGNDKKSATDLATLLYDALDVTEPYMQCNNPACSSRKNAMFFCLCGNLHLCADCVGNAVRHNSSNASRSSKHIISKKYLPKYTQCGSCLSHIDPQVGHSEKSYFIFDTTQTSINEHIAFLRANIPKWLSSSNVSTDGPAFQLFVLDSCIGVLRQLTCSMCSLPMMNEQHAVMKSACQCGIKICRSCSLIVRMKYSLHKRVMKQMPPRCSKDLESAVHICSKCRQRTDFYGVSIGFSLVGVLCGIITQTVAPYIEHRSLRQVHKSIYNEVVTETRLLKQMMDLEATPGGNAKELNAFLNSVELPSGELPADDGSPPNLMLDIFNLVTPTYKLLPARSFDAQAASTMFANLPGYVSTPDGMLKFFGVQPTSMFPMRLSGQPRDSEGNWMTELLHTNISGIKAISAAQPPITPTLSTSVAHPTSLLDASIAELIATTPTVPPEIDNVDELRPHGEEPLPSDDEDIISDDTAGSEAESSHSSNKADTAILQATDDDNEEDENEKEN